MCYVVCQLAKVKYNEINAIINKSIEIRRTKEKDISNNNHRCANQYLTKEQKVVDCVLLSFVRFFLRA